MRSPTARCPKSALRRARPTKSLLPKLRLVKTAQSEATVAAVSCLFPK